MAKLTDKLLAERGKTHGDAGRQLGMWGRQVEAILELPPGSVPAWKAALLVDALKTSRAVCGSFAQDHYDDKRGYTRIAELEHQKA